MIDTNILTGSAMKTAGITKSVVALCVALKMSPAQFVKAWTDEAAQLSFMAEVVHVLTVQRIAEAKAKAESEA